MRRHFLLFGLAVLTILAYAPVVSAGPKGPSTASVTRAEIFLIDWEVERRTRATVDVVRAGNDVATVLRSESQIKGLVQLLNPDALTPSSAPTAREGDFRLVVDLIHADGSKETYAAEYGRLVRLADGASRPIDAAFRQRFSFARP